jgi:regulator of sirC expression with transglutaminase-like and TPR domain
VEPAARDLEAYVAACPGAGDVPALRTQLDGLRGRRSGWLH